MAPNPYKDVPNAVEEHQEAIMNGDFEPTYLSTPPFSSPDPRTEGLRMVPLEDGIGAHQTEEQVRKMSLTDDEAGDSGEISDYSKMKVADLKALVEERGLEAEGNKKADYIAALQADDAADMKASDFIEAINAAEDQEALDAAVALYEAQDRTLVSVEAAVEKKQTELNEQ